MKRFAAFAFAWLVAMAASAAPYSSACIQPIGFGQTISGQLTTSDCSYYYTSSPSNIYYLDMYSFSGTAGQQVAISMTSPSMDSWLNLYDRNDSTAAALAHDDDGGGGVNARIPANAGWFTLPTTGTYYISAESAYSNAQGTGPYTLTLTTNVAPPPSGNLMTVYEFYHAPFNHYFITAYAAEAASLNGGGLPPWTPTGQTFQVWTSPSAGVVNVCRLFSTTFAPLSSHFYTNGAAECAALQRGGVWQLEATDAFYMMASPTGTCSAGTVPLYRLYNDGMGGAPNHRYTTSAATRSTMIAAGWIPEGNGPDGVFACVVAGAAPPASAFQQEVTGYADTILGLVNGTAFSTDALSAVLQSAVNALVNPTSGGCPVASTSPPLASLTTLPSSLTINVSYGTGCAVTGAGNVSGSAVLALTNLAVTDTSLSGSVSVTFNNLKSGGTLLANGVVMASVNLQINSSTGAISGPVTVSFNALQLPTLGLSGTMTIGLNTAGTTTVTTDITTSPHNVLIRLPLAIVTRSDGTVLINTTGPATVGAYAVQVNNAVVNPNACTSGATGGTVSFTKGGQTGTLTFDSTCRYTYSGP